MENNEKAIFLTAPAGMFKSIAEAQKCGRALQAMLNYNYDNLTGNRILIGISNVDADIAHYESVKNGVGRPKRTLQGDLENCFVDPHIHILVYGDKAEKISSIIIDYMIKKSKKYGFDTGKLIWKEYLKSDEDVIRVEFYIERQSFSRLTVNRWSECTNEDNFQNNNCIKNEDELSLDSFANHNESENLDLFEYLNDEQEIYGDKEEKPDEVKPYAFEEIYKNTMLQKTDTECILADLRIKWRFLHYLKQTAPNYELAYYSYYLQAEICKVADSVKMSKFNNNVKRIRDITLKIEQLQIAIDMQKEACKIALNSRNNMYDW